MAAAVRAPGRAQQDLAQVVDEGASEGHGRLDVDGGAGCTDPVGGAVEQPDVGERSARRFPATLTPRSVVASRSPKWAGSIRSTLSARSGPN